MNSEEVENMTVVSLRKELKARNLPTSGNKGELAQRLMEHLVNEEKTILQTSGFSVDEILDVPEEVVLGIAVGETVNDENKTAAKIETPVAVATVAQPQPSKTPLRIEPKTTPISNSPIVPTASQLNATKITTSVSIKTTEENKIATESNDDKEQKKIIPIKAPLSEIERKMLRAKKFNIPLAQTKETRAERFGLTKTKDSNVKVDAAVKVSTADQSAAKKQRAERFGLPLTTEKIKTAPKTTQEETSKLVERARRFGLDDSQSAQKVTLKSSDADKNLSDAIRKRKQRFGAEMSRADSGASAAKKMLRAQRFGLKF